MSGHVTLPYVGARVRWHGPSGTCFGRVTRIGYRSLIVEVEGSTIVRTLAFNAVTVLSAPLGGVA